MAFNNKSIKAPNRMKPHIVKIDGFWRVSPKPKFIFGAAISDLRWKRAHFWAAFWNANIAPRHYDEFYD